jgi:hypothetical protein
MIDLSGIENLVVALPLRIAMESGAYFFQYIEIRLCHKKLDKKAFLNAQPTLQMNLKTLYGIMQK